MKSVYEEYCSWNKDVYFSRCKISDKRTMALTYAGLRYILENSLDWPVRQFGTLMKGFEHLNKGGYMSKCV